MFQVMLKRVKNEMHLNSTNASGDVKDEKIFVILYLCKKGKKKEKKKAYPHCI